MNNNPTYCLQGANSSLVLSISESGPYIQYWGSRLKQMNTEQLQSLDFRQTAPASAEHEAPICLTPTSSSGFFGQPGIQVLGDGFYLDLNFELDRISQQDNELQIYCLDRGNHIEIKYLLKMDTVHDLLSIQTEVKNNSQSKVQLIHCSSGCIPLPQTITKITSFAGRWANEFISQTTDIFSGSFVRENRRGRTSHDSFPGLLLRNNQCSEPVGQAYGFHLGWSGNHFARVERLPDGRLYLQMGELLTPGEMVLSQGESYQSPLLYGCFSASGLNGISQKFHGFVRQRILTAPQQQKLRPVHYNTWEAVYFKQDQQQLMLLAEQAASIGIERFVLDDGWFIGRRNDQVGLGDWQIDQQIYPQGLNPLIEKVNSLGMEFGLWIEPEMVNPDSSLYRQHPNWVLQSNNAPEILARNQLPLDLTRAEVQEYLFECIDALLVEYNIRYLKWDMNRDLHQPIQQNKEGKSFPVGHQHTIALYQLIDRIKANHPSVEIESCASGGGRLDFEILKRTDRVWTSDSNDALDRLKIQKGFSYFFPAEVMGSHIGPKKCHITGRTFDMDFRVSVAFFGHMGVEANLFELDETEKQQLKYAIKLHKAHRQLIHTGDLIRLETVQTAISFAIIATERTEALFCYTQIDTDSNSMPGRLYFLGLDLQSCYQLNLLWPLNTDDLNCIQTTTILEKIDGKTFSGEVLVNHGLQLPILNPGKSLIFYLKLLP